MTEQHCLLIFPVEDREAFKAVVDRLHRTVPTAVVVALTPPSNGIDASRLVCLSDHMDETGAVHPSLDLAMYRFKDAFVYSPTGRKPYVLPLPLLHEIFNQDVRRIVAVDERMRPQPYRPFRDSRAKILSVFPGPMIPLHLGSHQRGFNLVSYLNRNGFPCDIMVTAGKVEHLPRLEQVLPALCSRVHTYKNNKRKLPLRRRAEHAVEAFWRRLHGMRSPAPDRFTDRAYLRPTTSAKRTLAELITREGYETIIINYAWMMDVLELVPKEARPMIIVDTHDVQFERNKGLFKGQRLLFLSETREKVAELAALRKADAILAISDADHAVLSAHLPDKDIRFVTTGFDYVQAHPKVRRAHEPLRFGFIGSKMDANVCALQLVIEEWWPIIRRHSPESRLAVAGTVGDLTEVQDMVFLDSSIDLLGRVASLKAFYDGIDVALSPVVIRGGLNFKSVEAILAGKHLFTNALGARCLGPDDLSFIIDKPEDLGAALAAIEIAPEADVALRTRRQRAAARLFTETHAYRALVDLLDPAAASDGRPRQVA